MNSKHSLLLLLISLFTFSSSCTKNEDAIVGDISVAFNPILNSNDEATYYYRLYVADNYPTIPPLKSEYIDAASYKDGKTRIVMKGLNPGNYVFSYYKNTQLVTATVQVSSGKTNHYDL